MPVRIITRLIRFSEDFTNKMVLPLLVLFLGTGYQTPNVPSALLERLFDDPNMRLWNYDPDARLPNLPTMYTFPNTMTGRMIFSRRGVNFRLRCEIEIGQRNGKGVVLCTKVGEQDKQPESNVPQAEPEPEPEHQTQDCDELVLCCPADEDKKILDRHDTMKEKFVLRHTASV